MSQTLVNVSLTQQEDTQTDRERVGYWIFCQGTDMPPLWSKRTHWTTQELLDIPGWQDDRLIVGVGEERLTLRLGDDLHCTYPSSGLGKVALLRYAVE